MKALYSTKATVTGGRAGKATLSDNDLSINMVPPGSDKEGNNPEQMFAIGYSACFDGALGAVKQMEKATFDSTTEIEVDLLQGDSHDYKLAAKIYVVGENTELSADEFQKLVEKAHQVCPYSKATRGNIDVEVTSEVK
ncbi:MAG: organic hydroperoxide resistance protein [Psychrobacter sp.]|uniref:organic hydroperoxide resistance protein n=1 Tax=Psychrobacter sp. TaxID=56811 RepID=UPI0026487F63|nr:organic hydroperoxide resistance protein [Psychrobacter sp.]MDN6275623.1 organic hydroperoxide resistance protein [Psychrobacter sp.]MDN6308024.1 organic hydroperoxide resistance protein [Psychrobacter sp.]